MFVRTVRSFARSIVVSAALFGFVGTAAAQSDAIARVKTLDGTAYVERDGRRQPLAPGEWLLRGDWIETGPTGALGIAFRDSTMISIGPESRILLREYAFVPAERDFSFVLDLTRGTLAYISGLIAKLMPDAVRIRTPASTVAVRGTRFLARVDERR